MRAMTSALIKRFRKEVKERGVRSGSTLALANIPQRASNALAAELLLKEILHERISIERSPDGIICGSREEAAGLRLREYSQDLVNDKIPLLSSLSRAEIETYLKERTGKDHRIYVPQSPEVRFVGRIAEEYPDVRNCL